MSLPLSRLATLQKTAATSGITLVTLTATGTTPTIPTGAVVGLALTQDATGSRTVTWPAGIRWDGGTVPTLATTAGSTDVFTFVLVSAGQWLGAKSGTYAPPADSTAPSAVTGLTAGTATATSIPLSWTAATDNVGISGYEYSLNGTSWTATGSTGTTYTVTGLTASTSYTIQVRAYDAAGNRGTAASVTNTTAAAPADSTAPTAPTNLAGAAGQTTMDLSWTASTDAVGVTGYRVSKDNGATWITSTVTGTTCQVTGLTAGTSYTFAVAARDAAGNWSTNATLTKSTDAAISYVLTEDFTGTSGTTLTGKTSTTGAKTWAAPSGTYSPFSDSTTGMKLTGASAATYVGTANNGSHNIIDVGAANFTAYFDYKVPSGAADQVMLNVRSASGVGNSGITFRIRQSGGYLNVLTMTDGTSDAGTAITGGAFTGSASVSVSNSTITLTIGSFTKTVTYSTNPGSTLLRVGGYSSTTTGGTATLANLKVSAP